MRLHPTVPLLAIMLIGCDGPAGLAAVRPQYSHPEFEQYKGVRDYTIREALELAIAILTPNLTDPNVGHVEQAQCRVTINLIRSALAEIPDDNIVPAERREQVLARLFQALSHMRLIYSKFDVSYLDGDDPWRFYNALDLVSDAAIAIRAGDPTFSVGL